MKHLKIPVFGVTFLLLFYACTPFLGLGWAVVFNLFLIMNALVIWMVIRVLKDGEPSGLTFDQRWYEDWEI